jgi:hypothetical protein
MKKFLFVVGALVAFAIPAAALGVDINPSHLGNGCPGDGTFHFVAPGGSSASRLTVDFSIGGDVTDLAPTKVTGGNAHWTIEAAGTVVSASATNARLLNLSDYTCEGKKDGGK